MTRPDNPRKSTIRKALVNLAEFATVLAMFAALWGALVIGHGLGI